MNDASAASALGHSAYIVLGLIGLFGPGTSYDLKRWADGSVGYFWTFPRSQLYAEPQRLGEDFHAVTQGYDQMLYHYNQLARSRY